MLSRIRIDWSMKMRKTSGARDKKLLGKNKEKTASVISRTEYMIASGVTPSNILLFTFTKKAADEMKERLQKRVGDVVKTMTVCTYHSFCARLLRKYAEVVGWKTDFSIYDDDDKKVVLRQILKGNRNIDVDKLKNYIGWCKDQYKTPDQSAREATIGEYAMFSLYYRDYMKEMKARNAFDFDDLLFFGYKIIVEHPDILQEVNDRYPYVIADESHDSSVQDMKFIMLLTSIHNNLTLVADTDQSIYGFRGADVNNFANIITSKDFKIYNLTRNFRSTQTVVNAAQDVILNNNSPVQKDTFSKNEAGDPIYYYTCQDTVSEAAMATKICLFMHKNQGIDFKDMAVLSRLNYQSRPIEESFLANGIPYKMAGTSFYSRQEIKDLIAYIRIAVNEHDVEAFERSVNTPKRGIGPAALSILKENFFASNQNHDTMYTIKASCENCRDQLTATANKGIVSYWNTIVELRNKISSGLYPEDIIDWLIMELNFRNHLRKTTKTDEELQDRWEHVLELKNIAASYTTFDEFKENLFLCSDIEREDASQNAVNIMTMHSAKGLEWKVVIIIGANEGTCPHRLSLSNPESIKEERRLFYVAMTRAKEYLFILRPKQGYNQGCMTFYKESRFVSEIQPKYLVTQEV